MHKPKISIVTITYNSEKTLEETIKSIINQEYSNLEYIIVDGGSTDNTLSITDKYKDNIDILISEPDKGISDAFNKGINVATGDIIGLINSDDLLLPNSLKILADNYSKDIDVYRGNTLIWNDKTNNYVRSIPSMKFPLFSIKPINTCHQSTFVSRKAYLNWGAFSLKYKYMMDVDLLTRYYQKGANMLYINEDLAVFRLGGVTNSTILGKRNDLKYLVFDNNGNYLIYFAKLTYFIIFQYTKRILFYLFGENRIRKLRY